MEVTLSNQRPMSSAPLGKRDVVGYEAERRGHAVVFALLDGLDHRPVPPDGTELDSIPTESDRLERNTRHPNRAKEMPVATAHQGAPAETRVTTPSRHDCGHDVENHHAQHDHWAHRFHTCSHVTSILLVTTLSRLPASQGSKSTVAIRRAGRSRRCTNNCLGLHGMKGPPKAAMHRRDEGRRYSSINTNDHTHDEVGFAPLKALTH